ncbi:hypothetical protein P8452_36646 [Trifolium repens]|nr:hypothetical protein P8452_36646 [Trifolium repens]
MGLEPLIKERFFSLIHSLSFPNCIQEERHFDNRQGLKLSTTDLVYPLELNVFVEKKMLFKVDESSTVTSVAAPPTVAAILSLYLGTVSFPEVFAKSRLIHIFKVLLARS